MICDEERKPEAGQWCSSLGKDRHVRTWSLKIAGAAGASCSGVLFCVSIRQAFPELFFGLRGQKRGQDQAMFSGLLRWGGGRGCVVLQTRLCLQGPDVAGLHRGPLWAFDPGPESVCPSRPMSLSSVIMWPGVLIGVSPCPFPPQGLGILSSRHTSDLRGLCPVQVTVYSQWVLLCLPSASFCPVFVRRLGPRACVP